MVIDECVSIPELVNIHHESVKKPIKNGNLSIHNKEKTSASWPTVCKHGHWILTKSNA